MSSLFEFESMDPLAIAEKYGTPVFVLSKSTFRERLGRFADAVSAAWPKSRFFYSIKANANPWLLREALDAGWGLDACSAGDIYLAERSGAQADAVSFAGVGVGREALDEFAGRVGCLNLCTPAQAEFLQRSSATVGLRVASVPSETGIAYESPKLGFTPRECATAVAALARRGITVKGLHCHCGSSILDSADYAETLRRSFAPIFDSLPAEAVASLQYVNVGGGLGIEYDSAGGGVDATALATELAGLMSELSEQAGHGLVLHCEPGEWVAGPAGLLLARVTAAFNRPGKRIAIVDASLNQYMGTSFFRPDNTVSRIDLGGIAAPCEHDVFGATNSPMDAFCRGRVLPTLNEGDLLALHCAGAYGYTRGGRFNEHPQAPEVLVHEAKTALIRARERMEDLDGGVPEDLDWRG